MLNTVSSTCIMKTRCFSQQIKFCEIATIWSLPFDFQQTSLPIADSRICVSSKQVRSCTTNKTWQCHNSPHEMGQCKVLMNSACIRRSNILCIPVYESIWGKPAVIIHSHVELLADVFSEFITFKYQTPKDRRYTCFCRSRLC